MILILPFCYSSMELNNVDLETPLVRCVDYEFIKLWYPIFKTEYSILITAHLKTDQVVLTKS